MVWADSCCLLYPIGFGFPEQLEPPSSSYGGCFFWFVPRDKLMYFPSSLGLLFHLKQHRIPTTPAKKFQSADFFHKLFKKCLKICFSITKSINKMIMKMVKQLLGILMIFNIGEFCFILKDWLCSGTDCTYCFLIRFLQYLQTITFLWTMYRL